MRPSRPKPTPPSQQPSVSTNLSMSNLFLLLAMYLLSLSRTIWTNKSMRPIVNLTFLRTTSAAPAYLIMSTPLGTQPTSLARNSMFLPIR